MRLSLGTLALASLAALMLATTAKAQLTEPPWMCGDTSGNFVLDTTDARLIQRFAVGAIPESALNGGVEGCDVNNDSACNTTDANLVQQVIVGALPQSALYCGQEIFITSQTFHKSALTSQAAIDQICNTAASNAGLFAGLGASWRGFVPTISLGGAGLETYVYTITGEMIAEVADLAGELPLDLPTELGTIAGPAFKAVSSQPNQTKRAGVYIVSPGLIENILFLIDDEVADTASVVCLSDTP